MKNAFILGCILVGVANMIIGLNIIITKILIQSLPIFIILELRFIFGILFLLPILFLSKHKFKFYLTDARFSQKQKFIYVTMALCGGVIFNGIYTFGMKNTTAMATGIIGSTLPLLVVAFSVVFLNQKLKFMHVFCGLLVAIGIFFITLGNSQNQSVVNLLTTSQIPNLIVFIAMIPEAMFMIFSKMLPQPVSAITSAFFITLINLVVCTPIFIYILFNFPFFSITFEQYLLCASIGLLSSTLFYVFYSAGIPKINSQTAGMLTGVVPISTTILAVFVLNESFGWISALGVCFVVFSIILGVQASSTPKTF